MMTQPLGACIKTLACGYVDPFFLMGMVALVVWSLVWKGFALWRSAKRHESAWFVILLVVQTVGILDIIYLFTHPDEER